MEWENKKNELHSEELSEKKERPPPQIVTGMHMLGLKVRNCDEFVDSLITIEGNSLCFETNKIYLDVIEIIHD